MTILFILSVYTSSYMILHGSSPSFPTFNRKVAILVHLVLSRHIASTEISSLSTGESPFYTPRNPLE